MPEPHRPDLEGPAAWRTPNGRSQEVIDSKLRLPWPIPATDFNNLLWPGFNLTDLSMRDETLLELLHTRCENQPRMFAMATDMGNPENKSLRNALNSTSGMAPRYVEGMDIVDLAFHGTPETYGNVEEVNNQSEMEDLLRLGLCTGPQAGRTMQVQTKIYEFLEGFCQEISTDQSYSAPEEDVPQSDEDLGSVLPEYDADLDELTEKAKFEDFLQTHYDLVPYSKPYTIDWEYLEALADRQLRRAEKRLKDMKESPLAFMTELDTARNHSIDMLRAMPGDRRMAWSRKNDLTLAGWAQHLGTALKDIMDACDTWRRVYTLIVKNAQAAKSYDGHQSELMEQSDSYRDNYYHLVLSAQLYEDRHRWLVQIMKNSYGLRDMYAMDMTLKKSRYIKQPKFLDVLNLVAIIDALENDDSRNSLGLWTIVAEIHELIKDDKALGIYISDYVRQYVEDLHAMGSIVRALQTLANIYPGTLPTNAKREDWGFAMPIARLIALGTAAENRAIATGPLGDTVLGQLFELVLETPLDKYLAYSKDDQPPGVALSRTMNKSEDRLSAFWIMLEEKLRLERALSKEVQDVLDDAQPIETYARTGKTPPKGPRPKAPEPGILPAAPEDYRPSKLISSTARRNDALMRNVEVVVPPPPVPEAAPAPAPEQDDRPQIELGQRAYGILELVMGPVTAAQPASIAWNDILRLMDEVGFNHEVAQGSARRFVPREELRQTQVTYIPALVQYE